MGSVCQETDTSGACTRRASVPVPIMGWRYNPGRASGHPRRRGRWGPATTCRWFNLRLFALGIVGTGLLAVPVLAGSAAYCVAEAFGWPATLEAKAPRWWDSRSAIRQSILSTRVSCDQRRATV